MHTTSPKTFTALTALGLVLFGCSGNDEPKADTIKVGFAMPFTGALATQGVTFEQGVELALQEINDHGGIRGKKIELVTKDTQTDGTVAAAVTQDLLDEGMTAILEGDGTASTLAMLDLTVPADAVLVAATAQTVSLARPENNGLFFRPGSNTLNEAGPLAKTVAADGNAKLAVISSTHPYTASLYGAFEGAFTAESCGSSSCEIVYHGTYPADADPQSYDYSSLVQAAVDSAPDALFIDAYPNDAKAVFDAVWNGGYRGPLYTSMAAGNENLAPFLPAEQANQIKWATLADAAGPSADFVRQQWLASGFRAEDFVGPVHSHYDGMFLLGLALAHASANEGSAIADSMREVANAPGETIYAGDWAKAMSAIADGRDIDYVGVTSDVDFDDLGDNTEIVTVIKGYSGGAPVVLSSE